MRAGALLLTAICGLFAADQNLDRVLSRVSEEAEVFRTTAPRILAREKLVQRAIKPPRRFRPRVGTSAVSPSQPQYRTREIVSEYGYAALRESPGALHEFRQETSVDGREVLSEEKAREKLVAGLRSEDDRERQRMLEKFEDYGLRGGATDFGQLILLFTRRRLGEFTFAWAGSGQVGAEPAIILNFRQTGGSASVLIVDRRKVLHQPLEGQLWVRSRDSLPLRIILNTARNDGPHVIRDEATVDYAMAPLGYLAPTSVIHRETESGNVIMENRFEYSAFRMFKADSEIKFTNPPADGK